eukprot:PhF_6_TR19071/c0_g1_i2/m.28039/K20352/TMED10, ERV25; p24 family protein delta-1
MFIPLLVLVVALCSPLHVDAIVFELPALQSRCFVEDLPAGFKMRVAYNINPGYSQFIDFKISEPSGRVVQQALTTDKASYDLSTNDVGGEYSFCFFNRLAAGVRHQPTMKRVVDVTFMYAADLNVHDNAARKEHLRPVESRLRMALDLTKQIQYEYSYMKEREITMRNTNESTNSRTMWAKILSACFGVVVCYIQVSSLKRYFLKRKFI